MLPEPLSVEAASDVVLAAVLSMSELRLHGRHPVRIRMHSLDAELILAEQDPTYSNGRLLKRLMSVDVVIDDGVRVGEPVAEFDP